MNLLFRVITAANATGTHHRLALDGIQRLTGPDAERWQRLFLKEAPALVLGSKAPDDEFKDFKNHVLHPRDGFWGGAATAARHWYGLLVVALGKDDWTSAAHCAGVLSHYVTDPVNPFHTAQSEAESCIHRAFEWSISRSYDELKRIAAADAARTINIADGDDWLEQLLCQAATDANAHYEKLIAHYDIHRGVVDPPAGLDIVAQRIVGDLIGMASAVFAAVLQRAITESKAAPPDVSLALDMILATLRIPVTKLLAKLADGKERALVERIYDELTATGTVETNLPEDDRAIRDLYSAEVIHRAQPPMASAGATTAAKALRPAGPRKSHDAVKATIGPANRTTARALPPPTAQLSRPAPDPAAREVPVDDQPRPAPRAADQATPMPPVARFKGEVAPASSVPAVPLPTQPPPPDAAVEPPAMQSVPLVAAANHAPLAQVETAALATATASAAAASSMTFAARNPAATTPPRLHLTPAQDIVDAPSIGPRMAERLKPIGLATVADLLAANPEATADKLGYQSVNARTVREWQDQTRLVCAVPGLRGTHAQLLVGAGFRTADAVAAAEPDVLCAAVLAFAVSHEGQRLLRNGDPPDIQRIKSWVDNARAARAA